MADATMLPGRNGLTHGRLRRLGLAAMALVPVALTLYPLPGEPDSGAVEWCLLCGELGLADALSNVVLFVPVGIALGASGGRPALRWLLPVLLSLMIEFVQLRVIPGRHATPSDVLANVLGAWLGLGAAWWWPRRRRSGALALAAAAVVEGVVALASAAFRPSLPSDSPYYGQWTAVFGHYATYEGRILEARLGGMALPSWRLGDTRAVRAELLGGRPLSVTFVAGPPPERLAPIFSVADRERRQILLLGADRGDLVWRLRSSAQAWRLRQPDLRWRSALAGVAPGDTLRVTVEGTRGGHCITLNENRRCLSYTVGALWGLLSYPAGWPASSHLALTVVALGGLGLLIGVVFRSGAAGWAAVALALAAAALIPPRSGLVRTPGWQLLALLAGAAAGARLGASPRDSAELSDSWE